MIDDKHENLTYKLFDQYFNNEEIFLQEERGTLPDIEQSYEKALSRGVEKSFLFERNNILSPQFHIDSKEQRLKNIELIDYYKNLED